jgi:hypothetical protein
VGGVGNGTERIASFLLAIKESTCSGECVDGCVREGGRRLSSLLEDHLSSIILPPQSPQDQLPIHRHNHGVVEWDAYHHGGLKSTFLHQLARKIQCITPHGDVRSPYFSNSIPPSTACTHVSPPYHIWALQPRFIFDPPSSNLLWEIG